MIALLEYQDGKGRSPFSKWFDGLNASAAARVTTYLTRLGQGNLSALKSVGGGVQECRIDAGPGYRVYLAFDGERIVILLGGGTKRRQQQDIKAAHEAWADYKARKTNE